MVDISLIAPRSVRFLDVNKHPQVSPHPFSGIEKFTKERIYEIYNSIYDKNIKNKDNLTLLMCASFLGMETMTENLIKIGVPIDNIDNTGKTALIYAVMAKKSSIVEILLEYGSCYTQIDNTGKTALGYAIVAKNDKIIKIFEKYMSKFVLKRFIWMYIFPKFTGRRRKIP